MTQCWGSAWEKTSGLGGAGLRPAGQSLGARRGQPSPGSKHRGQNPTGEGGIKALVFGGELPVTCGVSSPSQHRCPLDKGDSSALKQSPLQQERTGMIA